MYARLVRAIGLEYCLVCIAMSNCPSSQRYDSVHLPTVHVTQVIVADGLIINYNRAAVTILTL